MSINCVPKDISYSSYGCIVLIVPKSQKNGGGRYFERRAYIMWKTTVSKKVNKSSTKFLQVIIPIFRQLIPLELLIRYYLKL